MGVLPIAVWVVASIASAAPANVASSRILDEIVSTDFDLSGWLRLGAVTLEGPPFEQGQPGDLLDATGGALTTTATPVIWTLGFASPQVVTRVVLQPGSKHEYEVILTVVEEGGRRFAAGETEIRDGNAAIFDLEDVSPVALELEVARVDGEPAVHLSRIRVTGQQLIRSIELEDVPASLPEGGSFPIRILGRDSLGGRPDLTGLAQLRVTPERALALVERGRVETRVGGPISLAPVLGSLEGLSHPILVTPLGRAPAAPVVHSGMAQIRLELEGEPPFEVFRRSPGDKNGDSRGRTLSNEFFDDDLELGAALWYSARRIDRFGNPLTPLSEETRTRTLNRQPEGTATPGRLPVLVVLYEDSFADGEIDAILQSLEYARLFLYRQSRGQLVLDLTPWRLAGPTPSTEGPSMVAIERQLRSQGVQPDAYGVVFAMANDLDGNWGNFSLLGRTGGAFGRDAVVAVPPGSLGPDPAAAWSFVHELQHVIHQMIAQSVGISGRPSGHFDQDVAAGVIGQHAGHPLDVGEGWDGQAALLADMAWWPAVGPPYRRPLAVLDSDHDGLADADPWMPLDELRFGSDPLEADTDGDGLDDMAEAAAGLYGPSHPRNPDTDGDGLPDGTDPWPLSDFTGHIAYGTEPQHLASGPEFADASIELSACWTEEALVLRLATRRDVDAWIDLDGSGALGRWESDVDTGSDGAPASDVWCGPARIGLRAYHSPRGVFVGQRLLEGATLTTDVVDGRSVLTATLPARLGPGAADAFVPPGAPRVSGLRLQAGTVLGLAITVRPAQAEDPTPLQPRPADRPWLDLFETHRLLDAVLAAPTPAPAPVGQELVPASEQAPEPVSDPEQLPDIGPEPEPVPDDDDPGADLAPAPVPVPEPEPEPGGDPEADPPMAPAPAPPLAPASESAAPLAPTDPGPGAPTDDGAGP